MKATRYFATYLDAYNYYPNGVPSTEIAIVGDSSYILVSSDNAVVGTQAFFDAGMTNDQIVNTMVDTAYTNGYTAGTSYGYEQGYSYGYSYGYSEGEAAGGGGLEDDYLCFNLLNVNENAGNRDASPNFSIVLDEYSFDPNLEYSLDCTNWNAVEFSNHSWGIALDNTNEYTIWLRGVNENYAFQSMTFSITEDFAVSGNILSLYYGEYYSAFENIHTLYFGNLFAGCTTLVDASNLVLPTKLSNGCYQSMFKNCTSLATVPALNATTLVDNCYMNMFEGCTSLTTAPALPATVLTGGCYNSMFKGCTSLTTAPALTATTLGDNCYYYMFSGCTSLTTVPVLPEANWQDLSQCYIGMFLGCTSLTSLTLLILTDYGEWYQLADSMIIDYILGDPSEPQSTGTFYKNPNADGTVLATFLPSTWTITDYVAQSA